MPSFDDTFDPFTTCMIVIDMQNDFCSEGGGVEKRGGDLKTIREMIPRLVNFIDNARRNGLKIIFVRGEYGSSTSSPTWDRRPAAKSDKALGFRMCEPGSWGAKIIDELKPSSAEPVVVKHRYSAFLGTSLDEHLKGFKAKTLILTGVTTNVCVESTTRDGFMRDYDVVVLEDCVASDELDLHAASLKTIANHFGTVCRSQEILDRLQAT